RYGRGGHHALRLGAAGAGPGRRARGVELRRFLLPAPGDAPPGGRQVHPELRHHPRGDGEHLSAGGPVSPPYFGKYRGVGTDNQDRMFLGRVRAKVKDLGDDEFGWATACTPFAGTGAGFFAIPDVGVGVWIEFEHGDPEYPVWSGCWWGAQTDVPSETLS